MVEKVGFSIGRNIWNDFDVNWIMATDTVLFSNCEYATEGDSFGIVVRNAKRNYNTLSFKYFQGGSDIYQVSGAFIEPISGSTCVGGVSVTEKVDGLLDGDSDSIDLTVTTTYKTTHCCEVSEDRAMQRPVLELPKGPNY